MQIEGIHVPVITPFNNNGDIDYPALGTLIETLITAGVHGIVACGTTGEYYALSQEERQQLLAFIADKASGRVQLTAGANDTHTAGSIAKAEQAKSLGYDAIMLAPPIYCLPQEHEIIAHFKAVSSAVDIPIIMYNFPARSGVEISIDAVIELSADQNIIGIKESSGDFSRALTLLNANLDNFDVVCGSDDQGADYLFWGARSWIGGAANYLPEDHVKMIDAAKANDFETVRATMKRILPVIQNMESADYNQKAKIGCHYRGLDVGDVRAPLRPISPEDKAAFLAALESAQKA